MDKSYRPEDIETRIYERWEEHGWFAPQGDGEPYCIMIPPPNVTGTLHMGHAFQDTIMDALTRYHRMRGYRALWQPGMDHAGIATQMVVERELEKEGLSRRALGLPVDSLRRFVVLGHALLEAFDALGDVAHQIGDLAAPE